jgi:hypothetical protein
VDNPRQAQQIRTSIEEVEDVVVGYIFISTCIFTALLIALIRAAQGWEEFRGLLKKVFPWR